MPGGKKNYIGQYTGSYTPVGNTGSSVLGSLASGVGIAGGIADIIGGLFGFGYNKWAQEESWRREDTAVQRRAADLEAAGFSRTLAAGGAAQTMSPVRQEVPKADLMGMMRGALDNSISAGQLEMLKEDVYRKKIENSYLDNKLDIENMLLSMKKDIMYRHIEDLIKEPGIRNALMAQQAERSRYDYEWYKKLGLPTDSMSGLSNILGSAVRGLFK